MYVADVLQNVQICILVISHEMFSANMLRLDEAYDCRYVHTVKSCFMITRIYSFMYAIESLSITRV